MTKKHEYLVKENYYETNSVAKGRIRKICDHCGKEIPIGTPHLVHKFYPKYTSYATHIECKEEFMESLN